MQSFKEFGEYVMKHSRHRESSSNKVHIILNYPKIQWDDWAEYMTFLTWFSGIPLCTGGSKNNSVIFAETIDEALKQSDQYEYAMISYIGSFYHSEHDENIFNYFDDFCNSGLPVRGHILWHPGKQYGRLHPQTIFLNLNHWRKIGKPSFGLYTGKVMIPEISKSNVHDDYTPHWIKPSDKYSIVHNAEQAEYISKVLESGETILNLDKERQVKFFCYPERRYSDALTAERNKQSNIVYVRNNETIPNQYNGKKFDVIYAPASGYIAEYLWKFCGHKDTKLVIYDYNEDSLKWKRMTYEMVNNVEELHKLNMFFKTKNCIVDNCDYKQQVTDDNESIFSSNDFIGVTKSVTPDIIKFNILTDTLSVDESKQNLVYLSNIFSYKFLIHQMKIEDIHNKFNEYLQLPNTSVYGKNIFKDTVLHENHRS